MTLTKKRGPYGKSAPEPVGYTVRYIVHKSGGARVLSEMFGISQQAIYQWKAIPKDHAETISRLSGIPLAIVRPDFVKERAEVGE